MTLAPSRSHVWTACSLAGTLNAPHGYVSSTPPATDPDDAAAHQAGEDARREGTAAHWVAEGVLRGDAATAAEFAGETAPNGWIITPDMVAHVQGYVDYVRSFGPVLQVEGAAVVCDLIAGRFDCHTSGDAETLRMFDFKYGWRLVEAEGNTAMLCYAVARWNGVQPVDLHIYQPRPNHPAGPARVWKITPADMATWRAWLIERATAALTPGAVGTPGSHCRDCAGAASCEALAATVYAAFDVVQARRLTRMSAHELARELSFLHMASKVLAARKSAVDAEAEGRIARAEFIPGWMLAPRDGHRVFTVSPTTIGLTTGIDPYKPVLKTPAELEREGADLEIVKLITTTPSAGRKLVPATTDYFKKLFRNHK